MTPAPPVLAETTRRDVTSGAHVVESRHRGHLVVIGPDGNGRALGDRDHVTFARSAVKPFQATACLEILDESGEVSLTNEELAVAWASHRAESRHQDAVRSLLARSGGDVADLTCPPATPPDDATVSESPLLHNCSGKHAMFALAGAALGVPRSRRLDPNGVLQERVLGHLAEALGPPVAVAVDGCGAPAVAVPLARLARGFGRLIEEDRYRRVRMAGLAAPWHVGGEGRLESALLVSGVVAKPGAEAVFGAAWLDADGRPWSAAVKIDDGGSRAAPVVMQGLLADLGVVSRDLWAPPPVLGGGRPQGVVRAATAVTVFARQLGAV